MLSQVLYTSPCSYTYQIFYETGRFGTRRAGDLRAVGWQHRVVERLLFLSSWADAPERAGVCGLSEQCNLADDPGAGIQMVRATRSGWL